MIKEIILQQKREKEFISRGEYIPREKLAIAEKFLNTDLIKIITGPRRAGKSTFCFLLLKGRNFAYLNFDDESLLKIENYDELIRYIWEVYGSPEFIMLDEIQNLNNWELFVNKLKRRGYNLIITGSNSKLLSREFASALTGRHIPIEIYPFNFREFLKAKNCEIKEDDMLIPEEKGRVLNYLDEYLRNGGFPEVIIKGIEPKVYLGTLFDSILFRDVVRKYKVRFSQKIYDLSLYLINNCSSEFSFNKLKNVLDFKSIVTLQNYISFLEEAYIFYSLNRYSYKIKEQIKSSRKGYVIDNGFISSKAILFSQNMGRLMENLVFTELLKKGFEPNKSLFYYKTKNQEELDFVIKEDTKIKALIQVCYQIPDTKTREREIKGLLTASNELDCKELYIITWDIEEEIKRENRTIMLIPLYKWLYYN